MSSTIFNAAVTQIPSAWANDVNHVIYDLLGVQNTLMDLQLALGLGPVINGGQFVVTGGSINGTPIGAGSAAAGTFTRVRVTGTDSGADNVVTHGQLAGAIAGATGRIKGMAYQSDTAVDVTGGTIDGTAIGIAAPAGGNFTTLRANNPVSGRDVVNVQTFNSRFSTLPTFGSMASQNRGGVNITGGVIDGVSIGEVNPNEGWFTRVNTKNVVGSTARLWLDGAAPGAASYAILFDATSNVALDLGFRLQNGGAVEFISSAGTLRYTDGRMTIGATDNGLDALQVGGTVSAASITLGTLTPASANNVTSKQYVDARFAAAIATVGPAIELAMAALGNIVKQSTAAVNITGGAIDGVTIGGVAPRHGTFVQVNSNLLAGDHATIRLSGTGGYAASAAVIYANSTDRPNISVVPNANGVFAVMAGATAIFRAHVNGRTVVGAGGDDGLNTLQVYGDAIVHGKLSLGGGTMTGTTVASLGGRAPNMTSGTPIWTRIRVVTPTGTIECVVPAFQVL